MCEQMNLKTKLQLLYNLNFISFVKFKTPYRQILKQIKVKVHITWKCK